MFRDVVLLFLLVPYGNLLCRRFQWSAFLNPRSKLETIGNFLEMNANIKEGICYGLKYRTVSAAESCTDFLGPVQMSFLSKIGWEAKVGHFIRRMLTLL